MFGAFSLLGRNRDFGLMWAGQGLSVLGSQIATIALPLYLLRSTGSTVDAGLAESVMGLSFLAAMLPAGFFADRLSRRTLMLGSDLGGAAGSAVLGVVIVSGGQLPFPLLLGLVAASGLVGSVFHPAAAAALRSVVADRDLGAAIACNQARNQVMYLAGPIAGGLLFGVFPGLPFLVDAASFVVSALAVLAIRAPLGGAATEPVDSVRRALVDMVAGVRFIAGLRFARVSLPIAAMFNAVFAALVLVVIAASVRAGDPSVSAGLVVSCAGVGAMLGTLAVPLTQRVATPRTRFLALIWTSAAAVFAMAFSPNSVSRAVLIGLFSVLVPIGGIAVTTALTLATPDALQGRVQSATSFSALAITPLGSISAGLLLARLHVAGALLTFAALLAAAGVAATVDPGLRAIPDNDPVRGVADARPVDAVRPG
jgi:hypothetical protein